MTWGVTHISLAESECIYRRAAAHSASDLCDTDMMMVGERGQQNTLQVSSVSLCFLYLLLITDCVLVK